MTQQPRSVALTADDFVEWAMNQPSGRFELLRGEVVAMAPERVAHARVKKHVLIALESAFGGAGSTCEAFGDGMAVRVDESTVYEPDAMVRCGPWSPSGAVILDDPVIVVEVVSPSSRSIDAGAKLADYFRLPSVRHYLVVQPETQRGIWHERGEAGGIATRILQEQDVVALDPPGIEHRPAEFFATV
jgi:Uma2 family endonuclease